MRLPLLLLMLVSCAANAEEPKKPEARIGGLWVGAERGIVVELFKEEDGLWWGRNVKADRKEEVGKLMFQKLVFNEVESTWSGTMIKPDDDQKLSVTLKVTSDATMEAVAKVFIFSKTITFKRP
jgi:uncharacterized protein (DUF2147 family)